MTKEIIHFAHANGFPAGTYKSLFLHLAPFFEIRYIDVLGHNPKFQVTHDWDPLVLEHIEHIETQSTGPVIGLGHSLGGVITFLAALQRPDLFKAIILLDPPIIEPLKGKLIHLLKMLNSLEWFIAGKPSYLRKKHWDNKQEALEYFNKKKIFQSFDPEALKDYINYGTNYVGEGLELKFNTYIEHKIFVTMPHNYSKLANTLKVPGICIAASHKSALTVRDKEYLKKKFHLDSITCPGGHMFPFEYPSETAEL
ncbi:MAG: alpha/beta hydrolase, partial [Francisellaceae bacterium]|nr:alpha/beta hydrolase [Francisellaceae bacterium]